MPNYRTIARNIALEQGIDPGFFTNQIRAESNFNPSARSSAGALGIAQIVPKWHPGVDPMNPIQALNYAAKWDADLLKKYGGDWRQVLSTYNSGQPGKWSDPNFSGGQTYNYVRKILGENYAPGAAGRVGALPSASASLPTMGPPAPPIGGTMPPSYGNLLGSALLGALGKSPGAMLGAVSGALLNPQIGPGETGSDPGRMTALGGLPATGPPVKNFIPGSPVPGDKDPGGEHGTSGLAGYTGKDYMAPAGSTAVAPVSGKVIRFSGHDPKLGAVQGAGGPLGWSMYIQGTDGRTYYLTHMGSRAVQVGQTVKAGQPIGTVADYDSFGRPSHIHMGFTG